MHRTARRVALRARERRAALEVDAQLQPSLIGIKDGIEDTPRLSEPKRPLQEIDITHHTHAADSAKPTHRQLPTRFSEEPLFGRPLDAYLIDESDMVKS